MKTPAILILLALALPVSADIYVYRGENGEKLLTDRPMPGYQLISRRPDYEYAGRIAANRPIRTGGPEPFQNYIRAASNRHGVDAALIEAVIEVESSFDPDAVSRAGAMGLMQLMPATAEQYRVTNRANPEENINAGVLHLAGLMQQFDGELPLALAAYNAGATAVKKYRGIPPYPETERYVDKVLKAHARFREFRYQGKL